MLLVLLNCKDRLLDQKAFVSNGGFGLLLLGCIRCKRAVRVENLELRFFIARVRVYRKVFGRLDLLRVVPRVVQAQLGHWRRCLLA